MINIRQKSQNEIREEEGLYSFAAAEVKGTSRKACPTYVVINGEKKDTWDLTEEEILSLVARDVADFSRDTISYNKRRGNGSMDSIDLFKSLRKDFELSAKGNLYFLELEKRYGHIMMDLLGSLTKMETMNKARMIAQFQKETNGDFEYATSDEVRAIIEQMAINEENKKKQTRTR